MNKDLYLYVWSENVLINWSSGNAFAIARNEQDARNAIDAKMEYNAAESFPAPTMVIKISDLPAGGIGFGYYGGD
jgi:hypothetical protein